jgi:predicted Fe-Mo cluster-binding NifX family protein
MIIAIPIFGSEISPRFDCAKKILLASVQEGKIKECQAIEMKEVNPLHRARNLSVWKVEQVICGAIDDFSLRMLNGLGIRVFPWVSGDARRALEEFLANPEKASRQE